MIIAPLVFATIISGIVSMGKSASLGSITFKSMTWFITASFVSLAIGMGLANFCNQVQDTFSLADCTTSQ
jgi:Na+/H+-dicarboxylate symporter